MSARIVGTGRFSPPTRVRNEELEAYLRVVKPNGEPVGPDWLKKNFAINERRLDVVQVSPDQWMKLPSEKGGLYETEMLMAAIEAALEDAQIAATEVDGVVIVSCTPDEATQCSGHLTRLTAKLQDMGVRDDVVIKYANFGCAGMAEGLELASDAINSGRCRTVILATANCPSAHMPLRERYVDKSLNRKGFEWANLSLRVFADGAAAWILRPTENGHDGFLMLRQRVNPKLTLVRYPAGGMANPSTVENADDHCYVMDPKGVATVFDTEVPRSVAIIEREGGIKLQDYDLVLVHQANGRLIEGFIEKQGLDPMKVPIRTWDLGNMAAASTPFILDEWRRAGRIGPKSKIAFLWIGAGAGAHSGCAILHGVPAFPNPVAPESPALGIRLPTALQMGTDVDSERSQG